MITWLRRKLLTLAYPILYKIGKLHSPWTRKLISSHQVHDALRALEVGDIMLTRTFGEATNLVIPGYWKHAAIYVGEGNVVEAKDPVVVKSDMYDFMMTKDFVIIVRPLLGYNERVVAAAFSESMIGKSYDYHFEMIEGRPNLSFYCAEVPFWCYHMSVKSWGFVLKEIMGIPTVKPDDYVRAERYFKVIWSSPGSSNIS